MSTLRDAVAAPVTIEIGGRTWRLAPLTIGDLGELERWAADQPLKRLIHMLERSALPSDVQVKLLSETIKESSGLTMSDEKMLRESVSNEGRIQELWLAAKRADPTADYSVFRAAVNGTPEGTFTPALVAALTELRRSASGEAQNPGPRQPPAIGGNSSET